jgi:hypothetical protein
MICRKNHETYKEREARRTGSKKGERRKIKVKRRKARMGK